MYLLERADFERTQQRFTVLIEQAIYPFKTGNVELVRVERIYQFPTIEVRVETFPKAAFVLCLDPQVIGSFYPEDIDIWAGQKAGQFYASIREPVVDHICLGEN